MSCYKIPEGCCRDIEALLAQFWWGTDEKKRKIHWISWNKLGRAKNKGGLGFRDFSEFNKALLGKQCWRLITNEESLMSRVFKGKYFPRSNFLEANVGYQPSYVWRSMICAKEVMELGARWVIGDGKQVKIWSDSWLPEQSKLKVWSTPLNEVIDAKVCSLIDTDLKMWKKDVIINTFNEYEAQQILNIPLSWRLPKDMLIWHWEKHGHYSVRSAYHVLKEEGNNGIPETSNTRGKELWKPIWSVKAPNCVRNFLWRLAKFILPTRERLERKGMKIDPQCPLCCAAKESHEHLSMFCPVTQLLWFASPLGIHIPNDLNMLDWIQHWLSCKDHIVRQLFTYTLWKIWKGRNEVVFNKSNFSPNTIAATISDAVEEFNIANKPQERAALSVTTHTLAWEPPSLSTTKINIDAGCFPNGTTGWGMVVRNHEGAVSRAETKLESLKIDPTVAEALGLRWCLQWAKDQSFESLIVETDSEIVAKCINGSMHYANLDVIILDCLELLSGMRNSTVTSISRNRNSAAHCLVGMARNLGSRSWVGIVPDPLKSIICKDALFLFNQ
jgi:ribonuclease HI